MGRCASKTVSKQASGGKGPLVLEAGAEIGAAMRAWSHVRMFSP